MTVAHCKICGAELHVVQHEPKGNYVPLSVEPSCEHLERVETGFATEVAT